MEEPRSQSMLIETATSRSADAPSDRPADVPADQPPNRLDRPTPTPTARPMAAPSADVAVVDLSAYTRVDTLAPRRTGPFGVTIVPPPSPTTAAPFAVPPSALRPPDLWPSAPPPAKPFDFTTCACTPADTTNGGGTAPGTGTNGGAADASDCGCAPPTTAELPPHSPLFAPTLPYRIAAAPKTTQSITVAPPWERPDLPPPRAITPPLPVEIIPSRARSEEYTISDLFAFQRVASFPWQTTTGDRFPIGPVFTTKEEDKFGVWVDENLIRFYGESSENCPCYYSLSIYHNFVESVLHPTEDERSLIRDAKMLWLTPAEQLRHFTDLTPCNRPTHFVSMQVADKIQRFFTYIKSRITPRRLADLHLILILKLDVTITIRDALCATFSHRLCIQQNWMERAGRFHPGDPLIFPNCGEKSVGAGAIELERINVPPGPAKWPNFSPVGTATESGERIVWRHGLPPRQLFGDCPCRIRAILQTDDGEPVVNVRWVRRDGQPITNERDQLLAVAIESTREYLNMRRVVSLGLLTAEQGLRAFDLGGWQLCNAAGTVEFPGLGLRSQELLRELFDELETIACPEDWPDFVLMIEVGIRVETICAVSSREQGIPAVHEFIYKLIFDPDEGIRAVAPNESFAFAPSVATLSDYLMPISNIISRINPILAELREQILADETISDEEKINILDALEDLNSWCFLIDLLLDNPFLGDIVREALGRRDPFAAVRAIIRTVFPAFMAVERAVALAEQITEATSEAQDLLNNPQTLQNWIDQEAARTGEKPEKLQEYFDKLKENPDEFIKQVVERKIQSEIDHAKAQAESAGGGVGRLTAAAINAAQQGDSLKATIFAVIAILLAVKSAMMLSNLAMKRQDCDEIKKECERSPLHSRDQKACETCFRYCRRRGGRWPYKYIISGHHCDPRKPYIRIPMIRPTLVRDPNAEPEGYPRLLRSRDSQDRIDTAIRENEIAKILREHGYDIKLMPDPDDSREKAPDLRHPVGMMDIYSPISCRDKTMESQIREKVPDQAEYIVLDLGRCRPPVPTIEELRNLFSTMRGLKQIIVVIKNTLGETVVEQLIP